MLKSIGYVLGAILSFNSSYSMDTSKTQDELPPFQSPKQPLTEPLPAKSGTKIITPDLPLSLSEVSSPSPKVSWLNNNQLIYSFPPVNGQDGTIELLDLETSEHKILGNGTYPKPSPNGQWIAFINGKKEKRQLWVMDNNGTNIKQLTNFEAGIGDCFSVHFDFAWSPDSTQIAFFQNVDKAYWIKEPFKSTISILNFKTRQQNEITSLDTFISYLSWLPNGEELLFINQREGIRFKEEDDYDWVQTININDQHVRTLAKFDGLQQYLEPTSSPDGKQIAVMYDADNPLFNFMLSLGLISNEPIDNNSTSPLRRLTHEVKLSSPVWSKDSQHIYVRRDYGAYQQLFSVDAQTGSLSQLTNAPLDIKSYDLSPDGAQLAWIGQDAQNNHVLRIATRGGENIKDLAVFSGTQNDIALSEVREIEWTVSDYPSPMRGLLFMPLNYKTDTRYPLIVDIHGGGEGASIHMAGGLLLNSPLEWHMWAAKGYAVFVPEFRSSASFGSLAITRDLFKEHDLINCDIKDIEAGIDSLISQGIVDNQRIGVIGHSAGGHRANWLTATTHRFKAVISKEGWVDDWYQCIEKPLKRANAMFGGAPWEVPQNYLKNSALFHCKGVTTPTLFLIGNPEIGGVDPNNTVFLLHMALKSQGVKTEYVKYSDEGHVFEKPETRQDTLNRSIQWMDEHLGK